MRDHDTCELLLRANPVQPRLVENSRQTPASVFWQNERHGENRRLPSGILAPRKSGRNADQTLIVEEPEDPTVASFDCALPVLSGPRFRVAIGRRKHPRLGRERRKTKLAETLPLGSFKGPDRDPIHRARIALSLRCARRRGSLDRESRYLVPYGFRSRRLPC